jgi:hypothetical protein
MTLGAAIAPLPLAGRPRGANGRVLAVFGRVALVDYLLHIPAIHAACAPLRKCIDAANQFVLSARPRSTADQSQAR